MILLVLLSQVCFAGYRDIKYHYYISFKTENYSGDMEYVSNSKVCSMKQIGKIKELIKKEAYADDILITEIFLLREEEK